MVKQYKQMLQERKFIKIDDENYVVYLRPKVKAKYKWNLPEKLVRRNPSKRREEELADWSQR